MKYTLAIFFATVLWQSCFTQTNQKNKAFMDNNNQKKNPVYSKTDSSKLVLKCILYRPPERN
jgi:hypothetical protein